MEPYGYIIQHEFQVGSNTWLIDYNKKLYQRLDSAEEALMQILKHTKYPKSRIIPLYINA